VLPHDGALLGVRIRRLPAEHHLLHPATVKVGAISLAIVNLPCAIELLATSPEA
jgi:hypothetical protein